MAAFSRPPMAPLGGPYMPEYCFEMDDVDVTGDPDHRDVFAEDYKLREYFGRCGLGPAAPVVCPDDMPEPYHTQADILRMCLQDDYGQPEDPVSSSGAFPMGYPVDDEATYTTPMPLFTSGGSSWHIPMPLPVEVPGRYGDGVRGAAAPAVSPVLAPDSSTSPMSPCTPSPAGGAQQTACLACGKPFNTWTGMVRHHRAAHGAGGARKLHACGLCARALASRASLRDHMHLHTGERPYRCPHCDQRFARPGSLRHHVVNKHSEFHAPPADVHDDDVVLQDSVVGLRVVHRQQGADGLGGVVFQRAVDGGVVGVIAAPGTGMATTTTTSTTTTTTASTAEEGGLVIRLVRCAEPDVWRVKNTAA